MLGREEEAQPRGAFRDLWVQPYRRRALMMAGFNVFQTVGFYGFANWVPTLLVAQGITVTSSLAYTALIALAAPVAAQQQSQSYKFLEAVRKADGNAVIAILDQPGQTIINTRDRTTGEGALHIVVKRGDSVYTRYLLGRGADANMRDGRGNTPMMLAVQEGEPALIDVLALVKANPNLGNSGGETPLIRAVQRRDLALVRSLLAAGANPDQTDNVAGMSARDYAKADPRAAPILKVLSDTPAPKPRVVSGPTLR